MLDRLIDVLSTRCMLSLDRPIVVGVSGGPDSLCLMHLLHRTSCPIIVAHLNHLLRVDAEDDARLVQSVSEALHLKFVYKQEDIREYALVHKVSIEEAARLSRYLFLFDVADQENAQAVAVAHNAEDQVETFLMHLLRGSGLAGLRGMAYHSLPNQWSQTIPLVRPMLGFWRTEINEYLSHRSLKPAEDITNLDVTYARNRIRHGLVPYLESYNPEAKKTIWRTAGMLAGDYGILERVIADAYNECVRRVLPGAVAMDRDCVLNLPRPVARYVVRRAIAHLRPGLLDIAFDDIERLFNFLENPPHSGESDLAAGLELLMEGKQCWLVEDISALPTDEWPQCSVTPLELGVPSLLELPCGWLFESSFAVPGPYAFTNRDSFQAWIDPRKLNFPLRVRCRLPGDRFSPMGMEGKSLKLSDLMINERVPRRLRDAWPLVCSADHIVWVPGVRQSVIGQIDPDTKLAVHLRLQHETLNENVE